MPVDVKVGGGKADAAAFQFLVGGGVAELMVIAESEAALMHRERDEVVCGEFES